MREGTMQEGWIYIEAPVKRVLYMSKASGGGFMSKSQSDLEKYD